MVSSCSVGLLFAGVPISECEEDQLPGSRVHFAPQLWVTSKPLCSYYTGRPFGGNLKACCLAHISLHTTIYNGDQNGDKKMTHKNIFNSKLLEALN